MTQHAGSQAVRTDDDGLGALRARVEGNPIGRESRHDAQRRRLFFRGLRSAREKLGLNQSDLAKLMGTRQSSVSEMESGRVDPRLRTLQRQARALGLRLDFTLVDPSLPVLDEDRVKLIWERVEKTTISPLLTTIATHPEQDRTLDALANRVDFEPEIVRPILDSLTNRGWVAVNNDAGTAVYSLGEDRAAYVIGLSIERGRVVGALVNMHTKIVGQCTTRGLADTRRESVYDVASTLARDLYQGREDREVIGVGVSIAGVVDESSGAVRFAPDLRSNLDSWINVPLEKELQKRIKKYVGWDLRVAVDNDANSIAMREYLLNRPHSVMVVLMGGAGIGVGSVSKGRVGYGFRSAGAEAGHVVVDFGSNAPKCRAGLNHRGCLETLYGAGAIVTALGLKADSLAELRDSLTIAENLVSRGDAAAIKAFKESGEQLGRFVAAAARMYDPQLLVFYAHKEIADRTLPSGRVFQESFEAQLKAAGSVLGTPADPKPLWHTLNIDTSAVSAGAATMRHFLSNPPHWQPAVLAPRTATGAIQQETDTASSDSGEEVDTIARDEAAQSQAVRC